MDALSFVDVSKKFGNKYALKNVTFSIPRGTTAGLLGPNGAGKTTSIKIAVGILKRTSGEVKILNLDPWANEEEARQKIGVLHEKPIYPLGVRVLDLLNHLARLKGVNRRDVKMVLDLTGLKEYANARIRTLSRGFVQRLGLAQALLGDPEILLLDEPTANLDPIARIEILNLINNLRKELSLTIIISSHIIPELQKVCNYAVFIGNGKILDYGPMGELASRYQVGTIFKVYALQPRRVAASIIEEEYVESIEIHESFLKVRIKAGYSKNLENKILESGAEKIELLTANLEEIYKKAVAYAS